MTTFDPTFAKEAAQKVATALSGSCGSISAMLDRYEYDPALEMDIVFCAELDSEVFCCEQCGWWDELSEMSDVEHICVDCEGEG